MIESLRHPDLDPSVHRPRRPRRTLLLWVTAAILPAASGCAQQAPDASIPVHDLTVDTRSEPGTLLVEGTIRTHTPASGGVRFRLLSRARDLEIGILDERGSIRTALFDSVGGSGEGISTATTWEVSADGLDPSSDVTLAYSYRVSGTGLIFYGGEGLAFGSGLNFPWHPQIDGRSQMLGRTRFLVPTSAEVVTVGHRTSTQAMEAEGEHRFEISAPATLSFAVGEWDAIEYSEGAVPIRVLFDGPRRNGRDFGRRISEILDVLVEEFGPYPLDEFAVVEVPAGIANSAGFGGVSLEGWIMAVGPAMSEQVSVCFFAHEIAHQWWGNLVKAEPGRIGNGIVDEGLANYAAHRVTQVIDGEAAALEHRTSGCPLLGWIASAFGYFSQVSAGEDIPLNQLGSDRASQWLMDNKLYFAWMELARRLGPEATRAGFREIVRRHGGSTLSKEQLLSALSEAGDVNSKDLREVFEQWFERTGAPELEHEWVQDPTGGATRVTLRQRSDLYRLHVPIRLYGPDGAVRDTVVETRDAEMEILIEPGFPVWAIDIDPDFTFLHWTPELKAATDPIGFYIRGVYAESYDAAIAAFDEGDTRIPELDLYSACMFLRYARGRVHQHRQLWDRAREHLIGATQCPTRRVDYLPTVYLRIAELAIDTDDRTLFDWAVAAGISADVDAGRVTSSGRSLEELRFPGG